MTDASAVGTTLTVGIDLAGADHTVLVANPGKLRFIYKSDNKSDRFDAEQLARVAPLDPRLFA